MKITKGIFVSTASSVVLGTLLIGSVAFADTAPVPTGTQSAWGSKGGGRAGMMGRMPGVFGTVSAISGTTITVASKAGPNGTPAAATYTVDASSATVMKDNATSAVGSIAVGDTVMVQGTVSGTSVAAKMIRDGVMMGGAGGPGMMRPAVAGTVASVSGMTLTVTSKAGPNGTPAAATYTVDASKATVTKNGASSSVSAIASGDTVMVQGTVSGTSVAATSIRDGVMQPPKPIITGNGEPVVGGSITAISGASLTVTNKSNVTYTVDASSATIQKGNAASTLSSVAVGDNVVVQGTVNGNAVTASSVIDSGSMPSGGAQGAGQGGPKGPMGGFLGAIGGFFQHLFGFF